MQKTVKFLKHYPKRDWNTDNFVCGFKFSVIDTHIIGTPYEIETIHKLKVTLSDRLMINWRLFEAGGDGFSDDMVKVAFQSAEEYISGLIKRGITLDDELSPLERITENSPKSCPYKIINITYPIKDTFVVDFDKQPTISTDKSKVDKDNAHSEQQLKVFLCHATTDKPVVRTLYKRFIDDGVDAWLDQEKILPGQDWRVEIPKAVRNSDVVIVCLSNNSVNKEGYVQKEIKDALDIADEKPEETIFIIPARLEECDVPSRLTKYQWVDLFTADGYDKLSRALDKRFRQIYRKESRVQPASNNFPPKKIKYNNDLVDGINLYDDSTSPSVDKNSLVITNVFQVTDKYFDENSEPQRIIVQFTNVDENETATINRIRYSATGLGLPASALLSSYARENTGHYIIPFDKNKGSVLTGQNFTVELCLGQIWKRADINKWAGKWGYFKIDITYKDKQFEWFSAF